MTQKQREQLEKFKKFTRWMCEDLERSMFCARANFLVAMGLFNYIEILGTFMIGYFAKDKNGVARKKQQGEQDKTKTTDRFNKFFSYMGPKYDELLKANPKVYDELRCGLSHEYLPKNHSFCVYGVDNILTEEQMDNLLNNIDGSKVECGVVFLSCGQNNIWQIFNPKLFIDFKRAIQRLIKKIEAGSDQEKIKNFFETANQINLENFG